MYFFSFIVVRSGFKHPQSCCCHLKHFLICKFPIKTAIFYAKKKKSESKNRIGCENVRDKTADSHPADKKNADAPNSRLRDLDRVQTPQHKPGPRRWSNDVCGKPEQVSTASHTVLLRFSQLQLKKHFVIYFPDCKNNNLLSLSDGWEKASERYADLSVNSTACWKNKKR